MDQRELSRRTLRIVEELTSRKHSGDIGVLDRMGAVLIGGRRAPEAEAKGRRSIRFQLTMLATSSASVGVDVKHLLQFYGSRRA